MTLVPTPSVLSTSAGLRIPAGTRTIPPNAPTLPTESAVRVPATATAIRAFASSALARSTPAAAYSPADVTPAPRRGSRA